MIYIIHRSWSVQRIYKDVVSLRLLWVCCKKRQLAVRYYCSVATRNSQLCTRKNNLCSRCLTLTSPWPRKATHGCFHVLVWYRIKSDRHVLRRMLLKPKKKCTDHRLPGTDVPTTKMKYAFQGKIKSNNPHVHVYDIIWVRVLWISSHPSN